MSICSRFYTIGGGGKSICSFAAAKVLLFFDICKYWGGRNVRKNGFLAKSSDNIRPNGRKNGALFRVRDVIQIAHQCTMQEREKQPASNAGRKEERNRYHVLTCLGDQEGVGCYPTKGT